MLEQTQAVSELHQILEKRTGKIPMRTSSSVSNLGSSTILTKNAATFRRGNIEIESRDEDGPMASKMEEMQYHM